MNTEQIFTTTVGGKELIVKTGKLAEQAGGAVTLQIGDNMLLATATMSKSVREGLDFFPLSVDFEEKMYAAGRIPGGFFRREGRATTDAILIARLTDRPLRPLFPDGMRNEVQIIITTLSSDSVNHLDIMSVNAASMALTISDAPWDGPIGAVRVGYINGELVADPTIQEMEESSLDLKMAGTKDAILMVEASAKEVPESLLIDALEFGHNAMQPIISLQEEMRAQLGKEKYPIEIKQIDAEIDAAVKKLVGDRAHGLLTQYDDRYERKAAQKELEDEITTALVEENEEVNTSEIYLAFSKLVKTATRNRILHEGIRPDGRDYTTVRPLFSETGLSPRAHGSGLFKRGETQVLAIVALGTPREAQKLDGLTPDDTRRFLHHYNFPPFSTGETWFLRGPKRREIGHGALAQNALEPLIPSEEEFPYTIRVVSEVLSSNGSTSQASICASSLALMDCGVPMKRAVAGVAMGLISDGVKFAILSDIQGLEDHIGDMDFKVAGTTEGVTALQMDIKISGLSRELMGRALEQARVGRLHILENMNAHINGPREELSPWAPRMHSIQVAPDKIGAIIGKGGSTIRSLEEEFEVSIDIQDDGLVFIAGVTGIKVDNCIAIIKQLVKEPEAGEVFSGKVVRTTDFGAFVSYNASTDGLVHISQLSKERLNRVEDAVQVGDEVMVMITGISDGKIRLSRRAVLEGWSLEEAQENDGGGGGNRGGGRGGRGGGRGGDRGGRGGNRGRR